MQTAPPSPTPTPVVDVRPRSRSRRRPSATSDDSDQRFDRGADRSPLSISRQLRRSAGLPSGRALGGALLVTISVLGIVAVARSASERELDTWIVVASPIAAGETIRADHLATAQMDLIDETARRAVSDPDAILGSTALVPLDVGDLVLRATVADARASDDVPGRTLGLAIPAEHALGGQIAVGDRVDVVALGTTDIAASVLVRGALVTSHSGSADETIGASGDITLTLAVDGEAEALAVIDAHADGGVTLLRASSLELGGDE